MQTTIYKEQALGVNGVISKAETQYLATIQGVLLRDAKVGDMVFFGAEEGTIDTVSRVNALSEFVGFIVRDGYVASCETPTETYKAGDTVTVITKGSLFLKVREGKDSLQGNYLNFNQSTNDYDIGTEKNANFLGWRVAVGGAEGEVMEITTQF